MRAHYADKRGGAHKMEIADPTNMFQTEWISTPAELTGAGRFQFAPERFLASILDAPAMFGIYMPVNRRYAIPTMRRQGLLFLLASIMRDARYECVEQIAYVLATVAHETGKAFQPVTERLAIQSRQPALWRSQRRYMPFVGRGYVQLTWKENYLAEGNRLGVGDEFVRNPDRVLMPEISYEILAGGMMYGRFRRNHNLPRYVSKFGVDYIHARNVVNGGLDRAFDIALFAKTFERALKSSLVTREVTV